jgi:hypothetical protein
MKITALSLQKFYDATIGTGKEYRDVGDDEEFTRAIQLYYDDETKELLIVSPLFDIDTEVELT